MADGVQSKIQGEIGNQLASQIKGLETNQSNETLYGFEMNPCIDDSIDSSIQKLELFAETAFNFIKVFVILLLLVNRNQCKFADFDDFRKLG